MGIVVYPGTMAGGVTPACNDCGVHLCWDLSDDEYAEAPAFWDAWICETCNGGVRMSLKDWHVQRVTTTAVRATPHASRPTTQEKTMPFITRNEIDTREAARLEQIAHLKSAVSEIDANPLVPGEHYTGGDIFDGFYAGKILEKTADYLAIWSKLAARVAILPTRRLENIPEIGSVVAIHGWGSRAILKRCVPLTPAYGWLDAFDDFIVAFQRSDRDYRMSLANDGLCGDIFALNARGEVASWYRDHVAYIGR